MQLRPYQTDMIGEASAAYRAGHKGVLVLLATGGGKTVVYSEITRSLVAASAPVLIVEPAVELVEQSRDKLRQLGVPRVGIICASWGGGYNPDAGALVQVASVQTLRSRPDALLRRPRFTIYDEGHLAAAESYTMIAQTYPESNRLIATATFERLDGRGYEGMASAVVMGPDVAALQALRSLVPFRTVSIPLTEFSKSSRRPAREFNKSAMAEAYNKQKLVGDVIQTYIDGTEHTPSCLGRSGLVFAASIEHSIELCKRFNAAGIVAEHLDGSTPPAVRQAMIGTPDKPGRLGLGITKIVCNYGVLTAGFDCPLVSFIAVARATASPSLWAQMGGRGLRPHLASGKVDCIIHDHGANALRHGNLAHKRTHCRACYTERKPCAVCTVRILEGRKPAENDDEEQIDLGKECPKCLTVIDASCAICPWCAHDFRSVRARSGIEFVEGQLVEIDAAAVPFELRSEPAEKPPKPPSAAKISRQEKIDSAREYARRMAG